MSDDVLGMMYKKLMDALAQSTHETVRMMVTVQDMASTGTHGGGVGPHLEALLKYGHDFDLTGNQIDALLSQLKLQIGNG